MTGNFAEVIVDIQNRKVDRSYYYAIPEGLNVQIGFRVVVPFNKRTIDGIVVGLSKEIPLDQVKPILACLDEESPLNPELIDLARWMAEYYLCPFSQALHSVLPAPIGTKEEAVVRVLAPRDDPGAQVLSLLDPALGKVLDMLWRSRAPVKLKRLRTKFGKEVESWLEALEQRGMVKQEYLYRVLSLSQGGEDGPNSNALRPEHSLSAGQKRALKQIGAIMRQKGRTILLHGVTGSGKTEIYLRLISQVLERGSGALVLVPEIALTSQVYDIFAAAFPGRVALIHSALPARQRAAEYGKILSGQGQVVVGARSAVFAPVHKLELIIVDEEHEQSYKQDESPKYHVREVARKRAELIGSCVILGSATPSLESYALAVTGKYSLVSLEERVDHRPLPEVEIVDLREELLSGNRNVCSRSLIEKMRERFARGEQVILFLNRRGFSTFVVCRDCGYVAKCPNCEISLTYHLGPGDLRCHYCNHSAATPQLCPACSSRQINYFGQGTQKVEQEISILFPETRVLRLDTDTTAGKTGHAEIIEEFRQGKAQVLVGTQMVAKGLDFPLVTLVGVISADVTLNMADFRAKERTFQLLTQVAGRAGRGELPGEVVVQTYTPGEPAIIHASKHDYLGFFREEIGFRQALGYPPFNHILRAVLSSETEANVIRCAQDLGGALRQEAARANPELRQPLEILGPAPSPLSKLKSRYRWQVMLKGKQVEELKSVMGRAIKQLYQYSATGGISLSLDLDPMGML